MLFDFPTVSRPMSRPVLKKPSVSKESPANLGFEAKVFLYGQELNPQTWAIARSDLLNLKPEGKDVENIKLSSTLSNDPLPDKRFDFQFINPPYGDEWSKDSDVRWQFGVPPKGISNFAWVQRFIHHLAPQGMAGFVFANGSMSSNQSGEGNIRRAGRNFCPGRTSPFSAN